MVCSKNFFDISAWEIPYKSQVFKIFSGEKCRVCNNVSSKFLHDTLSFNISNIDVSACTIIDLKLWYWCVRL